jgi:hypothetical protein
LSIETSTAKVVTLSFSTPIGEISVTRREDAVAERLVVMRASAEADVADVGLVDLAAHEHAVDVAERHHQRGVGAEVQDRGDTGCRSRRRASARWRESAL